MLSISFQILYIPGTLLCAYMFKRCGLRKSFLFASLMQFVGSILRYISVNKIILSHVTIITNKLSIFPFCICLIGSCMAGLVQPFYTNSGARIAAEWFSSNGRDAATALLTMLSPLGTGLGSFLPTIWIKPVGKMNRYGGYSGYMLIQFICTFIGLILTIIFHKNRPPTPPSMSQRLKLRDSYMYVKKRSDNNSESSSSNSNIRKGKEKQREREKQCWKHDFEMILNNRQFFLLFVGFGVGLGLFNALTTLINQYTAAFKYSSNDAGIFGGILIAGGLFGAIIAGIAMEYNQKYRSILKTFTFSTILVGITFVIQLKENNFLIVTILFGIFGFCAVPIVAVTFECAAECCYPVNEEISSGLLMASGSLTGSIFILVWGSQLPKQNEYYNKDNLWNFSTIFIFSCLSMAGIFLGLFNGNYLRLRAESQMNRLIQDQDSNVAPARHSNSGQIGNNCKENKYSYSNRRSAGASKLIGENGNNGSLDARLDSSLIKGRKLIKMIKNGRKSRGNDENNIAGSGGSNKNCNNYSNYNNISNSNKNGLLGHRGIDTRSDSAETFDIDEITRAALINKAVFIGSDGEKLKLQQSSRGRDRSFESNKQNRNNIKDNKNKNKNKNSKNRPRNSSGNTIVTATTTSNTFINDSSTNVKNTRNSTRNNSMTSNDVVNGNIYTVTSDLLASVLNRSVNTNKHLNTKMARNGKGSINYSLDSDPDARFDTVSDTERSDYEYSDFDASNNNNIVSTPVTHDNIWDMQGTTTTKTSFDNNMSNDGYQYENEMNHGRDINATNATNETNGHAMSFAMKAATTLKFNKSGNDSEYENTINGAANSNIQDSMKTARQNNDTSPM